MTVPCRGTWDRPFCPSGTLSLWTCTQGHPDPLGVTARGLSPASPTRTPGDPCHPPPLLHPRTLALQAPRPHGGVPHSPPPAPQTSPAPGPSSSSSHCPAGPCPPTPRPPFPFSAWMSPTLCPPPGTAAGGLSLGRGGGQSWGPDLCLLVGLGDTRVLGTAPGCDACGGAAAERLRGAGSEGASVVWGVWMGRWSTCGMGRLVPPAG